MHMKIQPKTLFTIQKIIEQLHVENILQSSSPEDAISAVQIPSLF